MDKKYLNKLCDDVMLAVYNNNDSHYANANVASLLLKQYSQSEIATAMKIIASDKFATPQGTGDGICIKLTMTGIAFLHRDSYVEKYKRDKRKLFVENLTYWKHKLWWLISTITFIIGIATGAITNLIGCP